ncbi:MAG: aminotransferase class IV [bacterium]
MPEQQIIKNGELISKEQACISVFNKALFFDFCVYSNIKVVQGRMFLPDLEVEKLFESAQAIGLKHRLNKDEVVQWADKLIKANDLQDALIRILLIGPEQGSEAQLFLFAVGLTFYPDKFYGQGVKLVSFQGERYLPQVKSKNLLMSYIAYQHAVKNEALDALLIDGQGNIREGTRSSFFAIKDQVLIVPPKEKTLEGITKKIILEIATEIMEIKEEEIPFKDIQNYDECFITATTMKIMPVVQIDDIVIGDGVGEKTKELIGLYRQVGK